MLIGVTIVATLCPIAGHYVRERQEREKRAARLPIDGGVISDFGPTTINFDRQPNTLPLAGK